MFRGQRLGGFSAQPAVEFDSGNLGIGIWSNFPIKDEVPDTSDPEFDLYGFYNITVNSATTVVPGFTYYYYPNAPTGAGFYRGTFEPSLALNYTVSGVKITPKVYYDFTLKGPTWELSGAYALPLKDLGTEMDFTATYGTYKVTDVVNQGSPSSKAWGDYWLVGVAMPFQITRRRSSPSAGPTRKAKTRSSRRVRRPSPPTRSRSAAAWVSVSYAYTF